MSAASTQHTTNTRQATFDATYGSLLSDHYETLDKVQKSLGEWENFLPQSHSASAESANAPLTDEARLDASKLLQKALKEIACLNESQDKLSQLCEEYPIEASGVVVDALDEGQDELSAFCEGNPDEANRVVSDMREDDTDGATDAMTLQKAMKAVADNERKRVQMRLHDHLKRVNQGLKSKPLDWAEELKKAEVENLLIGKGDEVDGETKGN